MVKIEDITVINEIMVRLAQVTDEQLALANEQLGPPKAREIDRGAVTDATKALWVLMNTLGAERDIEEAKTKQFADAAIRKDHAERATLLNELTDTVKELCWCQARMDTGYWMQESVGLRDGWRLVSREESEGPPEALVAILKRLSGG
jgi:hypothetical protein